MFGSPEGKADTEEVAHNYTEDPDEEDEADDLEPGQHKTVSISYCSVANNVRISLIVP